MLCTELMQLPQTPQQHWKRAWYILADGARGFLFLSPSLVKHYLQAEDQSAWHIVGTQ
ncbi:unnamed protein product [Gulo gulo]|uniref:Uncharacterized protein n=1 Tax=Gulo gulo TaxID=48420 RepID=A0A9X9Q7X4_GULGU|nr:unnamed protein product [Gulo gulo]